MLLDSINYSVLAVVKCSSEASGLKTKPAANSNPSIVKMQIIEYKYNTMAMFSGTWAVILK